MKTRRSRVFRVRSSDILLLALYALPIMLVEWLWMGAISLAPWTFVDFNVPRISCGTKFCE